MSLAQRMLAIFEGSRIAHGTTTVGRIGRTGKAEAVSRIVKSPLTEDLIQGHIDGKQGVGAIPINEDNECRWGALDIDIYDLNHDELRDRIQRRGFPLLHCRSKSGGAHLYLFLKDYQDAKVVREYLLEMSIALGYSGCEIFPKQDKILADRGDVGNFINLPYFHAEFPQRYCFNEAGEAMELEEFLDAVDANATDLKSLETGKKKKSKKREWFSDGPPCLQAMLRDGPISEPRNKVLFNCARYCRMKFPEEWERELETMNQQIFNPPLEAKEVLGTQKSASRKEYGYTCDQEPFKSYCDKELCLSRKYGIGESLDTPQITGLTIVMSDPRIYFLTINGKRVELNIDQLHGQPAFQKACMDQIQVAPPSVKPARWTAQLQSLLSNAVIQEASEDLTTIGRFTMFLQEYCTSMIRAAHPEELKMGKPWTDNEGYTFFTMAGLTEYLTKRDFKEYTAAQIGEVLKRMGGGNKTKAYNKSDGGRTTLRVWYIPAFENQDSILPVEEVINDVPF